MTVRCVFSVNIDIQTFCALLQLRNTGLTELPFSINSLVNLKECGLEDNKIASLPADFGTQMASLEKLWLSNNHLEWLPENFGEGLTALRELSLDINYLQVGQNLLEPYFVFFVVSDVGL